MFQTNETSDFLARVAFLPSPKYARTLTRTDCDPESGSTDAGVVGRESAGMGTGAETEESPNLFERDAMRIQSIQRKV